MGGRDFEAEGVFLWAGQLGVQHRILWIGAGIVISLLQQERATGAQEIGTER